MEIKHLMKRKDTNIWSMYRANSSIIREYDRFIYKVEKNFDDIIET